MRAYDGKMKLQRGDIVLVRCEVSSDYGSDYVSTGGGHYIPRTDIESVLQLKIREGDRVIVHDTRDFSDEGFAADVLSVFKFSDLTWAVVLPETGGAPRVKEVDRLWPCREKVDPAPAQSDLPTPAPAALERV